MRFILAAILLVSLSACDKLETTGFASEQVKPTRDDPTFTMTIETVPESTITDRCSALGVTYDANGCAAFNHDTKHCTIYVVPPRHVDDEARFAVIGHETWHCRYGEWHK